MEIMRNKVRFGWARVLSLSLSLWNFVSLTFALSEVQKVSLWKKVHVLYSFFFVRKIVAHIVTFVFYCVVIPATVFVPEVEIPKWGAVYIPSLITLINAMGTPRCGRVSSPIPPLPPFRSYTVAYPMSASESPTCVPPLRGSSHHVSPWKNRSLHLLVFWILFENVMSLHRTKATFIGLLEAGRVNEWVVTEKLGDALKSKPAGKAPKKPRFRMGDR